jgi:predicted glycosyltransferase
VKIQDRQYRPVDLMPLCSRVVSKPGYSTYAEALKLDIPLISLTRSGFAESAIIINGLQDYGYHQIITPEQFFTDDWEFLRQPLQPPRLDIPVAKDGNHTIAQAVKQFIEAY